MSYLDRKLDPAEKPALVGRCLTGTRKAFLLKVETWLASKKLPDHILTSADDEGSTDDKGTIDESADDESADDESPDSECADDKLLNMLWISGAPGAGKSALASTIISKLLNHKCATFFIKRGATNPRTIWPSIARQLADLDRGVKLDLLKLLSGDAGYAYPQGASVEDQFRQLICEPLKRNFADGPTSSRRIVIIIDALDECNKSNQGDWRAFLDTIVKWSNVLPTACKLVVTS